MNIDLWALDRFEQIGRITNYTGVQLVERDLAEGGWQIDLPLGDAGDIGAAMLAADWPGIEVVDRDTGWRFGGYLTDYTVIIDDDGTQSLRLLGRDFQSDLAAWLEYPEYSTPDEWWAITYGGTIPATSDAHNTVSLNAGNLAASVGRKTIDGLVNGPDPAAGPPKARRLKGEPLLAVMRFLFADSADWTARLTMKRTVAGDGFVQFDTPPRGHPDSVGTPTGPLAPIVLDAARGTFGKVEHTTSAAKATWVIAMGAEVDPVVTPGERVTSITSSVEANWKVRHRELFINRPATDDFTALRDEVLSTMLDPESWVRQSAKVDSARVEGYGRDIDLGWRVPVHLGPQFTPSTVTLPVVASSLQFTPAGGWVRLVDLGAESLKGPAAIYASIARARAQIRQVEADSR